MVNIQVQNASNSVSFKQSNNRAQNKNVDKKYLSTTSKVMMGLGAVGVATAAVIAIRNKKQPTNLKEELLTFKDFIQDLESTGIKRTLDIQKNCSSENILGIGQNSVVYKFTNPIMNRWAIKIDNGYPNISTSFYQPIKEVNDKFEGLNMGQEIASIGDCVHILKRIEGQPHSIKNWSQHRTLNKPINNEDAVKFLNDIKEISKFPQESYDRYAQRLKLLDDKGFKSDSFNPNNIMVNYKDKEIHIIDAYKHDVDANMNSKYDLIVPLVDYPNFEKYYGAMNEKQKKSYIATTKVIINKCTKAAKKEEIKTDEGTFREFIRRIDYDREKNGGIYTNAFNSMMNHIH